MNQLPGAEGAASGAQLEGWSRVFLTGPSLPKGGLNEPKGSLNEADATLDAVLVLSDLCPEIAPGGWFACRRSSAYPFERPRGFMSKHNRFLPGLSETPGICRLSPMTGCRPLVKGDI